MSLELKVTLKRGLAGKPRDQRRTVRALGLRRIGHVVTKEDCPEIRGMIKKVAHLVEVEEVKSSKTRTSKKRVQKDLDEGEKEVAQ